MIVLHEPLAAGLMGLLFFGQVALQISLMQRKGAADKFCARVGPWVMAIMLVAALAVP